MTTLIDVGIIGAGPYGLSLAAHLSAAGVGVRVFGRPMDTWKRAMPRGMVLRSEGFASNLWHPDGAFTLRDYCAQTGLPYRDTGLPVRLETFADYGVAFQKHFVPMLDTRLVQRLGRDNSVFTLRLDDGETILARRVVIAVGLGQFYAVPAELDQLGGAVCSHSCAHHALERFANKHVLVIGAGASGVELAGLLSEQGARVTLAARQGRIDYCGSPYRRSVLEGLQAPRSGLGIGWRSWACAVAPLLVHQMPPGFREKVVTGDFGAVPGWRSRHRVETTVRVLAGATIARAVPCGGAAAVTFRLQDDAAVTVEADHVIAATGYKIDMNRLAFLGEEVRQMLDLLDGSPVLSSHFETSVPGLFVIGAAASESFGPLLRFTYGAGFASRRLSGLLGGGATRRLVAVPALRRTG